MNIKTFNILVISFLLFNICLSISKGFNSNHINIKTEELCPTTLSVVHPIFTDLLNDKVIHNPLLATQAKLLLTSWINKQTKNIQCILTKQWCVGIHVNCIHEIQFLSMFTSNHNTYCMFANAIIISTVLQIPNTSLYKNYLITFI